MSSKVKYPTAGRLPQPTKPISSINITKEGGSVKVTVQILMDRLVGENGRDIEGAEFGLALDGSKSMTDLYGGASGPFGYGAQNQVEPVAKSMIDFLIKYSGNGTVNLIYWAVGNGGREIEDIGDIGSAENQSLKIRPKKVMGGGTLLLPVVKHFVEDRFKNSSWSMGIIVTDGLIDDLDDVLKFCETYAVDIHNKKKNLTKLVLIGLGTQVDVEQLDKLDNFKPSVDIDIWSSRLASDMEELTEVFDEVMSSNSTIAPSAKLFDNQGKLITTFNDGLSAKFEFNLPTGSSGFKIEIPNIPPIIQDLTQGIKLL